MRIAHPPMIRYLMDPANAITAAGLTVSVVSISLALASHSDFAVALSLWALLADHLDGVIAKRIQGRAAVMSGVGAMIDTLADLVSAGVFPSMLLMAIAGVHWWTVLIAILAAGASALRLAVFQTFGSDGDRFIGVPTSWVIPAVALLFLARRTMPMEWFGYALGSLLLVLAGLQISSLRAPKLKGWGYGAIATYSVAASIVLAVRGGGS